MITNPIRLNSCCNLVCGPSTPDDSDGPEVCEESASFANMDFAVTTPKFPRVLFQLQVPYIQDSIFKMISPRLSFLKGHLMVKNPKFECFLP